MTPERVLLRDLVLLTQAVMEAGGSSGVLLSGLLTHNIAVPHMAARGFLAVSRTLN